MRRWASRKHKPVSRSRYLEDYQSAIARIALGIGIGILVLIAIAVPFLLRPPEVKCVNLGVVHVNDKPLLYQDCDGETIRTWLWVPDESHDND